MMRKRDRMVAALAAIFALATAPVQSAMAASEPARPLRSNKRLSRHSIPIVNVDSEEQLPPAGGASDAPPGPLNAPPETDASYPADESIGPEDGDLLADSPWVGDEYLDAAGPVFLPNMLGDFVGGFVFANPPPPDIDPRAVARTLNRYKVADNNSPLPRTRLLYSFNFFGSAFDTKGRIYRNFFGGEYAFLSQRVSIDARFNFNYYEGFDNSNNETQVGNFFTTLKGLIWRTETLAVSTGLAVGWPTGDFPTALPSDNTYVMPFLGALYYRPESRLYFQGFQQIDFPTQEKDQCLLHTDLGIGYFLLQDHPGLVNAIAGTTEFHLYTPLGGAAGGLYRGMAYDDVLNMTVGATAMTRYNLTVASAVSFPISHERDYAVEFQCHVNWYFRGLGRAYPPAPFTDEF